MNSVKDLLNKAKDLTSSPVVRTAVVSSVISLAVCCACSGFFAKKTIKKDPKFIISAIEDMYKKEQQKLQDNSAKKAPEIAKRLEQSNSISVLGNKNGSKVVVEFFDYNCGHCKRQSIELEKLIKQDSDVKVVLADLPILSANSLLASQVGVYIALNNNAKLKSYYIGLSNKPADRATIKAVVKKIGLNKNIVDKAEKDDKVRNVIEANYSAAKELNLQGTPALIVNGKFIGGMVSANELKAMLNGKK